MSNSLIKTEHLQEVPEGEGRFLRFIRESTYPAGERSRRDHERTYPNTRFTGATTLEF